ncbi:MAG: CarD family transcriptional regulator [Syntrophomonas sp.]
MFNVNDYVVYGMTGVCRITGIGKDEYLGGDETEYYVLDPVYGENMTIRIPVNNPHTMLRAIVTKEEVLSLIATMADEGIAFIGDDRERSTALKAALKSGKTEEWIKIIKTLNHAKKEKSALGKKLTKTDEDLMNAAEKQLHEEFAIVLDISPDEVSAYILEHIS